LTAEEWTRIKDILPPENTGKKGRPRKDNRIMLNGMLWIARTGCQWRELPEYYGKWQGVYTRTRKWRDDGILKKGFRAISSDADKENLSIESTSIKVHESANGGVKRAKQGDRPFTWRIEHQTPNSTQSLMVWGILLLYTTEEGANYAIPPKSNSQDPWDCDWCLYKERHLMECFFQKLKWFRRVATRYDKLDSSFLAFVYLAAIAILVK